MLAAAHGRVHVVEDAELDVVIVVATDARDLELLGESGDLDEILASHPPRPEASATISFRRSGV